MKTLTITNQTKFVQVFILPNDAAPMLSKQLVVGTHTNNPKTGEFIIRGVRKMLSGSVTLQPSGCDGCSVSGLPVEALSAPDIKNAIASKSITTKIVDEEDRIAEEVKLVNAKAEQEQAMADYKKARLERAMRLALLAEQNKMGFEEVKPEMEVAKPPKIKAAVKE